MFDEIPPEVFHDSSIWRKLRFIVGLIVLVGIPLGAVIWLATIINWGSVYDDGSLFSLKHVLGAVIGLFVLVIIISAVGGRGRQHG